MVNEPDRVGGEPCSVTFEFDKSVPPGEVHFLHDFPNGLVLGDHEWRDIDELADSTTQVAHLAFSASEPCDSIGAYDAAIRVHKQNDILATMNE